MNAPVTIVAGARQAGRNAPPGTIATIALTVGGHARAHGLVVVRMLSSRVRGSASKHLELRDPHNRHWLVRISDHPSPADTGYDKPHFDLVSRDGRAGLAEALTFIERVARREVTWSEPVRSRQRRGHHVRGQKYQNYRPGGCR